MDLFKAFKIFDPKASLEFYKAQFYQNWVILKHLTPNDVMFSCYIDLVDSEIEYLDAQFNYVPDWKADYDNFTELYFADMEVKVIPTGFKFNLN